MDDWLAKTMTDDLGGYGVHGPPVMAACKVAAAWAEREMARPDEVLRVLRRADAEAGIGAREGEERAALRDLWLLCAEHKAAPTRMPEWHWVDVLDPSIDPARPRLMYLELVMEVPVRRLADAPASAEA